MVSCLAYDRTGIVGAKLLFSNDKIQHAGVVIGFGGLAGHWYLNKPKEFGGPMNRLHVRNTMTCVTGAVMLISGTAYGKSASSTRRISRSPIMMWIIVCGLTKPAIASSGRPSPVFIIMNRCRAVRTNPASGKSASSRKSRTYAGCTLHRVSAIARSIRPIAATNRTPRS